MPSNEKNRKATCFKVDDDLAMWIDAFMLDRRAQNMAKGTLHFYKFKLKDFSEFCSSQNINAVMQIEPTHIRAFLLWLTEKGHNPGGISAAYRSLRAFLFWWENELEPEGWKNPIRKVKSPKVALEPLEPVSLETVKAIIESCPKNSFTGVRDQAIFLCLLDTGARAAEFINLNLADTNMITGEIQIHIGKGRKPRTVFIGKNSRKAIRQYLRMRSDRNPALWVTDDTCERLTYWGLKGMVKRRAILANVEVPQVHAFRRQFALSCLRAGMNVYSLQALMGHADLQVLKRYLKLTSPDLMKAHQRASPVDNL